MQIEGKKAALSARISRYYSYLLFQREQEKNNGIRSFLSGADTRHRGKHERERERDGICLSCYCTALTGRIEFIDLDRLETDCARKDRRNLSVVLASLVSSELTRTSLVFLCAGIDVPFLTPPLTYPNDLLAEDNNEHPEEHRANNDIRGRTALYSSSRRAHLIHMRIRIQLSVILSLSRLGCRHGAYDQIWKYVLF